MKVNERRTVVGGVNWPLCVPPTLDRDRRACESQDRELTIETGASRTSDKEIMRNGAEQRIERSVYFARVVAAIFQRHVCSMISHTTRTSTLKHSCLCARNDINIRFDLISSLRYSLSL